MNFKKLISLVLLILTISTLSIIPAYAAISADLNNKQIVSKVEKFNNSGLAKLRFYIWKTNYAFIKCGKVDIVRKLISLYQRLDNLVVPNMEIADELCPPPNTLTSNSIATHVDLLVLFLTCVDNQGVNLFPPFVSPEVYSGQEAWNVITIRNKINILNYILDQIASGKN